MTQRKNKTSEQYHLMTLNRDITRLEKLGTAFDVPKGYEVNVANTVPEYCYLIKEGKVLSYELTYNGDMRSYNYMVPGSLFLEDCLLLQKPCPVTFKTITPCTIIRIDRCALMRGFKEDVDLVMDVYVSMADKFLGAMEQLRTEPVQPSEWKICRLLMSFANYNGVSVGGNRIKLPEKLRQQEMADLLGMNRITVTRKLKQLEEDGYLSKIDGFYYINDTEELTEYMSTLGNKDVF